MFSYFGSKSKIARYYPEPEFDTIIEPFAGSAQYSYLHWEKQVILIEKYERIYKVWDWLINEATPEFILSLPLFQQSEKIIHDNPVVRDLIAFESHGGSSIPVKSAAGFNRWAADNGSQNKDATYSKGIGYGRKRIADNLYKIKHWEIINGDYSLAPDIEATWFIDPPYFSKAGLGYKESAANIDYKKLGEWCKSRKGQVIVCEEEGASWLPFRYFKDSRGQSNGNTFAEAIWTNDI